MVLRQGPIVPAMFSNVAYLWYDHWCWWLRYQPFFLSFCLRKISNKAKLKFIYIYTTSIDLVMTNFERQISCNFCFFFGQLKLPSSSRYAGRLCRWRVQIDGGVSHVGKNYVLYHASHDNGCNGSVYDITGVHANRKRLEREYTETMHFLLYKIILKHSLIRTPTIRHCEIREKTRSSAASYQENGHRKRP
jgi:hypothetical protein